MVGFSYLYRTKGRAGSPAYARAPAADEIKVVDWDGNAVFYEPPRDSDRVAFLDWLRSVWPSGSYDVAIDGDASPGSIVSVEKIAHSE